MRRSLCLLALLTACAPAPEAVDPLAPIDTAELPLDAAPVPVALTLAAQGTAWSGNPLQLTLERIPANTTVLLAATTQVLAPPACPRVLRGGCLDIGGQLVRVAGPDSLVGGVATFTLPQVPQAAYVSFQAVAIQGNVRVLSQRLDVEIRDTSDNDSDGDGVPDPLDEEVCDGVDNDGDGLIDEDTSDVDGDGIPDCLDEETCDDQDNDGDGLIDEGFDTDGDGVPDCFDEEQCDGLDNDGDGLVDEDFADTDGDGVADCVDEEVCDGVDNDGDGLVDEGFDVDDDGIGDCFDVEGCDGIDNDGDGLIDEGFDPDGDGVSLCFLEACAEGTPDAYAVDFGQRLVTVDLDTDTVQPVVGFGAFADAMARLPDGRIVLGVGTDVDLLDVATGTRLPVASVTWGVYGMAVDGAGQLWVSDADELRIVDPDTGAVTPVVTAGCFPNALAWEGSTLYATCGADLVTLDVVTGQATVVASTGLYNTAGLSPLGDGRLAVFGGPGWMLFDPATGSLSQPQPLTGLQLFALDAAPLGPWCGERMFETCDGTDDDGDGLVDEGFSDLDADGIADCVDVETCDGLDNDGDGAVDEGFDINANGVADCFEELCNCVDDDLDGEIDETCTYELALQVQSMTAHIVYLDGVFQGASTAGWAGTQVLTAQVTGGSHLWQVFSYGSWTQGLRAATFVDGVLGSVTGDGSWWSLDGPVANGPIPVLPANAGPAYLIGPSPCTFDLASSPLSDLGARWVWSQPFCQFFPGPVTPQGSLFQEVDVCGPTVNGPGWVQPPEVCDGIDNDGDGFRDEGFDLDGNGRADCFDVETACNGLDDDGDGVVDDGFTDTDGDGVADCVDVETCDGVDNDGDTEIDEGFDIDGDGVPDCEPVAVEACNCVDDDGDGAIDEDCTYEVRTRWLTIGQGTAYMDGVAGLTVVDPADPVEELWTVQGGTHRVAIKATTNRPDLAGMQAILDGPGLGAAYSGDEAWRVYVGNLPSDWQVSTPPEIAPFAPCVDLPTTPLETEGALWIWGGDCANPTSAPTNGFVQEIVVCGEGVVQ